MKQTLGLIDFMDGQVSQGVPAIIRLAEAENYEVVPYDLRGKMEIPNIRDHDKFIATGGPGHPSEYGQNTNKNWGALYHKFTDDFFAHNKINELQPKKFLSICHSSQVLWEYYGLAKVMERPNQEKLYGVYAQTINPDAVSFNPIFADCFSSKLCTMESRFYQMVLNQDAFGPKSDFLILSTRDDNGIMALTGIGSKDGNYIGTQFHPEAFPDNIRMLLTTDNDAAISFQNAISVDPLEVMLANAEHMDKSHNIIKIFLNPEHLKAA